MFLVWRKRVLSEESHGHSGYEIPVHLGRGSGTGWTPLERACRAEWWLPWMHLRTLIAEPVGRSSPTSTNSTMTTSREQSKVSRDTKYFGVIFLNWWTAQIDWNFHELSHRQESWLSQLGGTYALPGAWVFLAASPSAGFTQFPSCTSSHWDPQHQSRGAPRWLAQQSHTWPQILCTQPSPSSLKFQRDEERACFRETGRRQEHVAGLPPACSVCHL